MIAHLQGKVIHSAPQEIILQVAGVGYEVKTSQAYLEGEEIQIFIEHVIREDAQILFGFDSLENKKFFQLLTSVNGVGPKTAFNIISTLGASVLIQSILQENVNAFKHVAGVGVKTAKQLILQLKDKVEKWDPHLTASKKSSTSSFANRWENENKNISKDSPLYEGVLALESLGYSAYEAKKILEDIYALNPNYSSEQLIKTALMNKN
ncbi:MAG: Holliday junction branch migration protein RuvA [Bacteriovoracaceae bacterium]|nr:Holliday junction branch migration protein RuvA [Bacteriovoracaceae bacterium]